MKEEAYYSGLYNQRLPYSSWPIIVFRQSKGGQTTERMNKSLGKWPD